MHDSNHTDDFEQYLQDQVNDHRMYPSDRVWKNIRGKVNPPKKWPALSVFTVLIISGLVIGTVLNKPVPDSLAPNFISASIQSSAADNHSSAITAEVKNNNQPVVDNYTIDQLTNKTIIAAVERIKIDEAVAKQLSRISLLPFDNSSLLSVPNLPASSSNINTSNNLLVAQNSVKTSIEIPNKTIAANQTGMSFKNIDTYLFDVTSRLKNILNTEPDHLSHGGVAFFIPFNKRDLNFDYDGFDLKVSPTYRDLLPLDRLGKSSSRFDFRFYVTPSVSYRKLKESKTSDGSVDAALESNYKVDPSKAINQTPALGYETGFGLGYKLTNKLTLTSGFQFNVSRYKINAFLYKDEPINVTFNEGAYANTVSTVSSLRSVPGTTPITIRNRYYQLSVPVGIEWEGLTMGKFNLGVGASVQPTYTFDKQPLIISSNYKNYADGSAYVRNWNVNANVETFLGYTTGSYRWQIGPQLRYQMLPSLVDKYPNKEYLFNYGLKIGVVKQLR